MLFRSNLNKVIFGGARPRFNLFLASQLGRSAMEGVEEGGQEGVAIKTANAFIFDTNEKRAQMGLAPLEAISIDDAIERIQAASREGAKVGFVLGIGPGTVSATAREKRLNKIKALRKEMNETRARVFLEHEKVGTIVGKLETQAHTEATAEYKDALNGAEEGDLWARARELQNQSTLTGENAKIEDQPGDTIREKLVNFILSYSETNDYFLQRYQFLLDSKIENDTELQAADKLLTRVGLANENINDKDLLGLRRILDHAARNLVDKEGKPRFADINEAAGALISELNSASRIKKFLQGELANYKEDSLEHAFLKLFLDRTLYRDMPVASKYGVFSVEKGNARTIDEAYQSAIYKATQMFFQRIQERLQGSKVTVDQEDIVNLFNILEDMAGLDENAVMDLQEDGKILNSIRALGGTITFNKDTYTAEEQKFMNEFQEMLNNLIYAVSSKENVDSEKQRDGITKAFDYIGKVMGEDFLKMLKIGRAHV